MHDAVECGRAIRVLSVVDAYTRECLALEVDTSFASRRVTRVLEAIVAERGQPAGDPLRQRAGADQPAFSGVVRGTADRVGAHSAGQADAERACGELSRTAAGRVLERELVSEPVRCASGRSQRGGRNTTKNVRTAVWDTGRRKSLRRAKQRALEKTLAKKRQLGKRERTRFPLSHSSGDCCFG